MQRRNCLSAEKNLTQVIYNQKRMEKHQKVSKFCLGSTLKVFLDYRPDKYMCSTLCVRQKVRLDNHPLQRKHSF